jgi:hypothetical protein
MTTAVIVYTLYLIIMGVIVACMIAAVVKTLQLLLG